MSLDGREPFVAEQMREGGAVEARLALAHVGAVRLPPVPSAGPIRLGNLGQLAERGDDHSRQRRHQAQALRIDQDVAVALGEAEPMVRVDLEQARDGLLLEPLARVALIGPGPGRQLVGRSGPSSARERYQPRRSPR